MKMTRALSLNEIEDILDFIVPQEGIPKDTAMSIVERNKDGYRKQLKTVKIYPDIISVLKEKLRQDYMSSLIQAGESVGIIGAQSMGEKTTQTTLNSVEWNDKLLYEIDGRTVVEPIGQMVDRILDNGKDIQYISENRTEYMELPDGFKVPSCDEDGKMNWYKIEAVTRHLPIGELVKVRTYTGREVTATQSKSFLVWNGDKFIATQGCDIKLGDIVPITKQIGRARITTEFNLRDIFSPQEYIYTDEIIKARSCPGFVHKANEFFSRIPSKITLDNDFGFFIGIYLADGYATKTFLCVRDKDENIRNRVTEYCDRYGVTYHLVTCGKNVHRDLRINSVILARLLKQLCDTESNKKKIPDFVYGAPDEFLRGLIDGYFSGVGTVSLKDGSVVATSSSQDLTIGISTLLSYFGVYCHLNSLQNNTYSIRIRNGFAQKFINIFKLTDPTKQEHFESVTLTKKYCHMFGKSQELFPKRDVYFDKVVSVEYVTSDHKFVYDLTVETTRNFQMWNGLNMRDTFHKAGVSEKTMTAGVPRFQELLNVTKKPSIVNHKVYYPTRHETIQSLRLEVRDTIVGLTMEELQISMTICMNKVDEPWYEAYKIIYQDDRFAQHDHCISIKLNMKKLYEFSLTMQQIAEHIHDEYGDLFCVFSPPAVGQLDIFVDTNPDIIKLPEDRVAFIDSENVFEIYMEECVFPTVLALCIKGIPAILEIFYTKDENTGEWFVETNSIDSKKISSQYSSYKKLLALPNIDMSRTISNNVWDIYEVLGIEAARQFLIEEFMSIMEGINHVHAEMLVDRMTYGGGIDSISRYTLRKDESGPMGKASFEETQENFIKAASQGDCEPTSGVSASIICGKRARIGTGMSSLKIDISQLPNIGPFQQVIS